MIIILYESKHFCHCMFGVTNKELPRFKFIYYNQNVGIYIDIILILCNYTQCAFDEQVR